MSSLSISGAGQGLSQLLQGLSPAPASAASAASSAASATSATTATSSTTSIQRPGGHHHHGGRGGGKLFQQVEQAVTSALQSAQSSGTSSDPNQVIQDAISKVFKQATGPASATTGAQQASGTDPDGDGDTGATGQADSDNTAHQAFAQTLRSFGVSPSQFQSDFLAAIKDAQQNGQFDVSAALKSLPPGTVLDTIG